MQIKDIFTENPKDRSDKIRSLLRRADVRGGANIIYRI